MEQESKERIELKEAALPLIKLLNEQYHPHHVAIITATGVEILEGCVSVQDVHDYLVD